VAIIGTRGYPSYYGGFETAVRKLAPYLADRGWDVTVYGRKNSTSKSEADRDPRIRTKVTFGLETKSISTLSYGLSASVDAAKRKPDVALVMNVANGYFLPLLRLRGIPSLVNVDGIEWDRAKWGKLAKGVFHVGAKWTARHGTQMVYDSREIQSRWKSEFDRDGDFIPYGGDIPPLLPIEEGLAHRQYVLVVARFVPENTVPEFLQAVRRLPPETDVVIVGSSGYGGDLDEDAAELARSNPKVRWLGHVSDDQRLLSLWQHAGVYFHGHSVGGTNPALVQAMACGSPTVARDTAFNREVLGKSGIFVEASATAIAAAITSLLGDSETQSKLSFAATKRAGESYAWDSVCSAYEAALSKLCDARTV
jgi:glycosyltransferase involved in cell wall biosynthesis